MRGAVHERWRGQAHVAPHFSALQYLFELRHGTRIERRAEDVLLAPEYALGHSRGASRIEDVEVIRRESGRRRGGGLCERRLVVEGTGQERFARVVGDLEPQPHLRKPLTNARQDGREAGVVEERAGTGVAEQIEEFLLHVAVIDVERRNPRLVGAQHPLQVLVAVVEIQRQVVLPGLPTRQPCAFLATAEAVDAQHVGQASAAVGDRSPVEAAVAEDQAVPIRDALRDGLVDVGQIKHGSLPDSAPPAPATERSKRRGSKNRLPLRPPRGTLARCPP